MTTIQKHGLLQVTDIDNNPSLDTMPTSSNVVGYESSTGNQIYYNEETNSWTKIINYQITGSIAVSGSSYSTGSAGQVKINVTDTTQPILHLSGTDTRGGAGYFNFLKTTNIYSSATNKDKYFRQTSTGDLEIINSNYSATLLQLGDVGSLKIPAGSCYFGPVKESFSNKSGSTGTVVHDCSTNSIFYHTTPSANWTSNFTNLNLSASYATTVTTVIAQGSTAYLPTAVQIEGSAQTLNWQGNTTPVGTANRTNVVSFSILNNGGTYIVLGQVVSF
jgi:hypothetical protein